MADKKGKISTKIVSLDDLERVVRDAKKEKKTVVHCHGVFDLLHPGHMLYLEAAKKEGDLLVVTVTQDAYVGKGPGRPVFNQQLRAQSIAALQVVDYVSINEWPTAIETIKKVKPHVYAKGAEYQNAENDVTGNIQREQEAVESVGGRIHFANEMTFSSSELLNRHFMVYPDQAQEFLKKFRAKYSPDDVVARLKKLEKLKVLVIGETIIDEYHYCHPVGKSAKESIVASKYSREESFAGGVLACANHVAGFVNKVHLVTVLGAENSREDFIAKNMKPHITSKFIYREDAPTIVKRRYVWDPFLVKLFELIFMNDTPLPTQSEKELVKHINDEVPKYDVVIVADYGHGMFTKAVVDALCKKAKFLAVNTQTNSANTGYNLITKWPRADYVCIDDPEVRLAFQNKFGDLRPMVKQLATKLKSKTATITRGHNGSLVYTKKDGFVETPIFSKEIVDRVGAGDAFLAITAPCVAAGLPSELIGFIGNTVGALAVKIVGNRSAVESVPLIKFITALLK